MKTRRIVLLMAILGLLVDMASDRAVGGDGRPPNIVYILADDLGYGELGSYGQRKIQTPHLDRMAREGMRFTQHYSASPVCAPARCSLLTGKHGGFAYIRSNREVQPLGQLPIPADEVTIARLLKDRGYATAAIGKWGLGPPGSSGDPNHHGFDLFFGNNCQRIAHSYYPPFLWRNREQIDLSDANPDIPRHLPPEERGRQPDGPEYFDRFKGEVYSHDLMIEEALNFIRQHRDEPFFLYYAALIPHLGLQVPDEDLQPYLELGWDDEPYLGENGYVPHPLPRAAYAAMISRLDREVGQMMALLKELELDENTLVLFTSDNGATHLEQVDVDFFNSNGGLRGFKGSVDEGGIRVPMIARWPGRIPAGSATDLPSYFPDVLPTVMDVIGAPDAVPDDCNGLSFAPTLFGQPKRQQEHPFLVWEFHGYRGQQAVRMGDWKGIRRDIHRGNRNVELYHLGDDPGETIDVAEQYPEVVQRIEQIMAEQRTPSEHFPMPFDEN